MLFYFSGDELELHYIELGTYSQMVTEIDPHRSYRKIWLKKILKLGADIVTEMGCALVIPLKKRLK